MIVNGPTRIVLLHSGKYDFAEVELDRAVHLVAPNNLGKTTLIAALQFLYIDHANQMDFSYDLAATRKYYFPSPFSYVLYECLTPKGYQVLGVHGQGPVQSYHYERFRYTGQFQFDDYLDDERRPRRWEDVRVRLAARDFTLVQPRNLASVLTGQGGRKANSSAFSIVPVRQNNGYERFRKLFTHLLKLGKLRQEDLKQVLIETWQSDLVQRKIDLEGSFRTRFEEIRRHREQVDALTSLLPLIHRAMESVEARDEQREVLPALWASLDARANQELRALGDRIGDATARARTLAGQAIRARAEAEEHRAVVLKHRERLAVLTSDLQRLDGQTEEFRSYEPLFEDAAIQRLDDEIGDLHHRLRSASTKQLTRVLRDLDTARTEREEIQRQLDGLANLVVTAAREHLDDTQLARAFAIINPDLLGQPIGQGVEVRDLDAAVNTLRGAAERSPDGGAVFPGVIIAKNSLRSADIHKHGDPGALREQLDDLAHQIRDLETLEHTLRQERELRRELKTKQSEHQHRIERRGAYQSHLSALERRPALEAEHDQHARRAEDADAARRDAVRRSDTHDKQSRAADREAEGAETMLEKLRESLRSIESPHWPHESPVAPTTDAPLPELFREYRSRTRREADADTEVKAALAEVERIAYDQYVGDDEAQTLHKLRDARDALPERKESLRELWKSLVVGLKSAFKNLGNDLDILNARINDLNRALRKTSVSNLDRLALRLERNRELGKYVKDVQTNEAMPLFGSPRDAQRALERIGELLRLRPIIRLEDMFDLHFEVTTPDGEQRKYPHLDRIESNGTTVTIKVLVSLHLLRALLTDKDVRIPFFLDEVSSLDHRNLRGIVEAAEGLGFCPILASPEASDAAEVLYYLREGSDGRIVLNPDSAARVEIRRAPLSESLP